MWSFFERLAGLLPRFPSCAPTSFVPDSFNIKTLSLISPEHRMPIANPGRIPDFKPARASRVPCKNCQRTVANTGYGVVAEDGNSYCSRNCYWVRQSQSLMVSMFQLCLYRQLTCYLTVLHLNCEWNPWNWNANVISSEIMDLFILDWTTSAFNLCQLTHHRNQHFHCFSSLLLYEQWYPELLHH